MRILVVNPNSTTSMTVRIAAAARSVAAPGTEILAVNPPSGPASIEGYYDEALAVPGLLAEIERHEGTIAGTVIACFDDVGLDAARSLATAPVIGICEAAMQTASLLGGRFSVVTHARPARSRRWNGWPSATAWPAAAPSGRRASRCWRWRIRHPAPSTAWRAEIRRAMEQDGAESIVLGCAGMADLARSLGEEMGLPVVDGVTAAVKLAEGLAALGLRTSKAGGYAAPLPKAR